MAIIKEMGARFTATDKGITAAFQGIEKGLDGVLKKTENFNKKSSNVFGTIEKKAGEIGKSFGNVGENIKAISRPVTEVGSNLTNWITKPALIATGAVAGMFGGLGAKRLIGLDNAKAKLEGMGYTTEEVGDITQDVTKAIEGGMTTMAEGVDIAAGAMGAGVKEGKELQRYIGLVGDAAIAGQAPIGEMAQVFNRIQGQGKMMRNELQMIEYRMPGFTSSMVESMGVTRDEFEEMVTNGEVTSEQFLDAMETYSGGAAEAYAKTFEGMGKNALAYVGILGETMLESIFEDGKEGMARLVELLQSDEAVAAAQRIGEALKSALDKVIEFINKVVNWWQKLDDETRDKYTSIAKWVGILGVTLGPVLLIIGKAILIFGSLFTAIGTVISVVGTVIGWFGTFFGVVATVVGWVTRLLGILKFLVQMFLMFASPVTIVVAAIGLLVAGFIALYKNSERFRGAIDRLVASVKEFFVGVWDKLKQFGAWLRDSFVPMLKEALIDTWGYIMDKIRPFITFMQGIFNSITNAIKSTIDYIKNTVIPTVMGIVETVTNAMKAVYNTVLSVLTSVGQIVLSILTSVYNVFKSIFDSIMSVVKFIFNGIYSFIKYQINMVLYIVEFTLRLVYTVFKSIFNAIKTVVSTVVGFIVNFIKTNFNLIKSVITTVMTVILSVISSIWNRISTVFNTVLNAILDFVRARLQTLKSVITTIMTAVRNVFSTIWNAISRVFSTVLNAIFNFVRARLQTLRSVISSIMTAIRNVFSTIWNAIRNVVVSIATALFNRVRNIFNSMRSTLSNIMNTIRNVFSTIWNTIRNTVTRIATNIFTAVRNTFDNMKNRLSSIMESLKTSITGVWEAVKKTFTDIADGIRESVVGAFEKMKSSLSTIIDGISGFIDDMVESVKKGLNKLIDGVNWVAEKIGMDKLPHVALSTGTVSSSKHNNLVTNGRINRDTFATVGDKGRGNGTGGYRHEMIRYPNGRTIMTPDTDTTAYLPKGSMVFNGRQTQEMVPQFSTGTLPDFIGGAGITRKADKGMTGAFNDDKVSNRKSDKGIKKLSKGGQGGIFRSIGSAVKSVVGKASDIVGDVMDYVTDPSKLVDKVFDAFGLDFNFLEGSLFSDMLNGMVGKLKSGLSTFLKGGLDSAGKGDGSSFDGYRETTPYSPNAPVPGYPTAFNKGHHYGIDYGTPTGTTLSATNTGTVSKMSDRGGGLVAKLLTGKFTQFFLHLSSILKTGKVNQGDAFAKTGNSGEWTTGSHLHYQVEKGDSPWVTNRNTIDPQKYLSGLKGYARGDIITSPQIAWLAEGGFSESVISHDPKHQSRSKAIYDRTGDMLGFNEDTYYLMELIALMSDGNELQEKSNNMIGNIYNVNAEHKGVSEAILRKPGLSDDDIGEAYDRYNHHSEMVQRIYKGRKK